MAAFGAAAALRSPPLRAAVLIVRRALRELQPRLVRKDGRQVILPDRIDDRGVEGRSRDT
ncbi:MAG: hypothetical protein KF792_24260 [Chelatococcus sp.]|nr:hypothetical protein [Chelatococcus sp.]